MRWAVGTRAQKWACIRTIAFRLVADSPLRACQEITTAVCHLTNVAQPLRLPGRDSFRTLVLAQGQAPRCVLAPAGGVPAPREIGILIPRQSLRPHARITSHCARPGHGAGAPGYGARLASNGVAEAFRTPRGPWHHAQSLRRVGCCEGNSAIIHKTRGVPMKPITTTLAVILTAQVIGAQTPEGETRGRSLQKHPATEGHSCRPVERRDAVHLCLARRRVRVVPRAGKVRGRRQEQQEDRPRNDGHDGRHQQRKFQWTPTSNVLLLSSRIAASIRCAPVLDSDTPPHPAATPAPAAGAAPAPTVDDIVNKYPRGGRRRGYYEESHQPCHEGNGDGDGQ